MEFNSGFKGLKYKKKTAFHVFSVMRQFTETNST